MCGRGRDHHRGDVVALMAALVPGDDDREPARRPVRRTQHQLHPVGQPGLPARHQVVGAVVTAVHVVAGVRGDEREREARSLARHCVPTWRQRDVPLLMRSPLAGRAGPSALAALPPDASAFAPTTIAAPSVDATAPTKGSRDHLPKGHVIGSVIFPSIQ